MAPARSVRQPLPTPSLATPVLAVLTLLIVWPTGMLLVGALRTAPPIADGAWTTAGLSALTTPSTLRVLGTSLLLATLVSTLATSAALALAFLSERTDAALRGIVPALAVASFATPLLFLTVGAVLATNRASGLLDHLLAQLLGGRPHAVTLTNWGGIVLLTSVHLAGFAYLFLRGPVRALSGAHHEASRVSGAGALRTLLRIELPLLAPAITGVVLVVFVVALGTFDTVQILANDSSTSVVATRVYALIANRNPPDYATACALSILLVLVVVALVAAQRRLVGGRIHVTVGGRGAAGDRTRLGALRWVAGGGILAYGVAFVALPLAALVVASLQPYPGVYRNFGLDAYRTVLSRPDTVEALRNTLLLGVLGGLATMSIALVTVRVLLRHPGRASGLIRSITQLPLGMPSIVAGLATLWAVVSVPGLQALYGSIWLIFVALVVVALPASIQLVEAAMAQIAPELEEAARTSGAGRWRALRDVVGRLLLPTFVAGWLLAAIVVAGDLQVPLLLGGPGSRTVASVSYGEYGQGKFATAAALLCLELAAIAVVAGVTVSSRALWRARRRRPRVRLAAVPRPASEA